MSRSRTRRQMTQDRERRRALRQELAKKKAPLAEIFGPFAEKIWLMAMVAPSQLKDATDGVFRSSRATLDYFLENPDKINIDMLVSLLGISKETYLATVGERGRSSASSATVTSNGTRSSAVDESDNSHSETITTSDNSRATTTVARNNSRSEIITSSDNSSSMAVVDPINDGTDIRIGNGSLYQPVNEISTIRTDTGNSSSEAVTSEASLKYACWLVFGASRNKEGLTHMHKDYKGYPTIGAGHLVYKTGQDKTKWRNKYIEDMTAIGISPEQAGADFDAATGSTTTTCRRGADVITSPHEIKITEEQARKLFERDLDKKYRVVSTKFPNLHSYPVEVQVALMHTAYHGSIGRVNNSSNVQDIVREMARAWASEAKVNPRRAREVAAACEAVGVNPADFPPIARAAYSKDGNYHNNNYIQPMVAEITGDGRSNDNNLLLATATRGGNGR